MLFVADREKRLRSNPKKEPRNAALGLSHDIGASGSEAENALLQVFSNDFQNALGIFRAIRLPIGVLHRDQG